MRSRSRVTLALACSAALVLSACGSDDEDGGGGSGGTGGTGGGGGPIRLGYLTSVSGPAAVTFVGVQEGAEARLAAYAEEGRECSDTEFEVVVGDDASTPQGALAGAQSLVQQEDVYAVLPVSSRFFGAGDFAGTQAADTPFVGAAFDGGAQWQNPEYRNLFSAIGTIDYEEVATTHGDYFQAVGGTRIAAVSVESPSSAGAADAAVAGAEQVGLERGYVNTSVPVGSTDVGTIVLGIQESGADVLFLPVNPDTAFAIVAGLRQLGVEMKSIVLVAGYGADLLASGPAVQAAQGVSFANVWAPTELDTEATRFQSEALREFAGSESGIPSFSQGMAWLATDLFLHGLEQAGCDASQQEFIDTLREDDTFDGGGLLGAEIDFAQVGDLASGNGPGNCFYVVTLEGESFVPEPDGSPVCGELVE